MITRLPITLKNALLCVFLFFAVPSALAGTSWPMRQRDVCNTSRADFTVPGLRLNDTFFDELRWQKPTPGSPSEGGLSSGSMVFYDGAGPAAADLVVGGYHWLYTDPATNLPRQKFYRARLLP